MEALFADIPSALANTVAIARRCSLTLVLGKPQLPDFPTPIMPDGKPQPMDAFFRELSHQAWKNVWFTCSPMRPSATACARTLCRSAWTSRSTRS